MKKNEVVKGRAKIKKETSVKKSGFSQSSKKQTSVKKLKTKIEKKSVKKTVPIVTKSTSLKRRVVGEPTVVQRATSTKNPPVVAKATIKTGSRLPVRQVRRNSFTKKPIVADTVGTSKKSSPKKKKLVQKHSLIQPPPKSQPTLKPRKEPSKVVSTLSSPLGIQGHLSKKQQSKGKAIQAKKGSLQEVGSTQEEKGESPLQKTFKREQKIVTEIDQEVIEEKKALASEEVQPHRVVNRAMPRRIVAPAEEEVFLSDFEQRILTAEGYKKREDSSSGELKRRKKG